MDTLRVRVYNVRFGDAVLVSIPERDARGRKRTRHLLIDVGNVLAGEGGADDVFEPVMRDILAVLEGRPLDLYVMTHEHLDHVQGLVHAATKLGLALPERTRAAWLTASAAADYYERHPNARKQKVAAERALDGIERYLGAGPIHPLVSALMLNNNPRSTAACVDYLRGLARATTYVHREASLRQPFREARLSVWAPEEDTSGYYGAFQPMALGLASDAGAAGAAAVTAPLPPSGVDAGAFYDLVEQRRGGYLDNLLAIDKAANNTSIVLCLEWRGWRLLFPGDAEERSWKTMATRGVLQPVHFLKVGHHGSANGTPPAALLDRILPPTPPDGRPRRAALSTCLDTYHNVPDEETLSVLRARCEVLSVLDVPAGSFVDIEFPAEPPGTAPAVAVPVTARTTAARAALGPDGPANGPDAGTTVSYVGGTDMAGGQTQAKVAPVAKRPQVARGMHDLNGATGEIKTCIDRFLPEERRVRAAELARAETPMNAPVLNPGLGAAPTPAELAALTGKLWAAGRTLRVRFLDGDASVQARLTPYIHQWSEHGNIRFVVGNDPEAEIRISFRERGSWSYLGTDALSIPRNQATMNFGWLTPASDEQEYARVGLHEVGHALGCFHEHQHPQAGIPWDKEAVYRYYGGPPNNWTREQVDTNLFQRYDESISRFSAFDPASIMLYPIDNRLTIGDYEVGWNTALSATDKHFIGMLYPHSTAPARTELVVDGAPAQAGIGAGGEVDLYQLVVPVAGRYVIETWGPTDVVMTLYGPNSETAVLAEDDDSGQARNARIVRQLERGTYGVRIRHYRPTGTGSYRIGVRAQAPIGVGRPPATLADFEGRLRCEYGHDFPAAAGVCPRCLPDLPPSDMDTEGAEPLDAATSVPAVVQAFINQFVTWMDNGKAPRSAYGFGYRTKIGIVNHIPVCQTLAQLTNYFNGGAAEGSTHFGIGRETAGTLAWEGTAIPFAPVHQYMAVSGPFSPWAQGVIATNPRCDMPPSPTIAGMSSGEPNEAFVSIENVAMTGRDGLTEAQFNSNVMLRAFCAARFGHAINPLTQLWHSEIDQLNRCFDPGWSGALEDAMQDAANRLLRGDTSGLLGMVQADAGPDTDLAREQIALIEKVLSEDWVALQQGVAAIAVEERMAKDGVGV